MDASSEDGDETWSGNIATYRAEIAGYIEGITLPPPDAEDGGKARYVGIPGGVGPTITHKEPPAWHGSFDS